MTFSFSKSKAKKLLPLIVLASIIGLASAAVFTMYYASFTATVKTPDIQLAAGPDSTASPTSYPAATVTVASTYDYATVAFSIFPSATNTPQPATYYTNLLQIKNVGTASHTINSITISGITGASNLGNITIYYYATQTDNPDTSTAANYITLTSSSTGSYTLVTSQTIAASATNYIEIVGYADSSASSGSTVSFNVAISWV